MAWELCTRDDVMGLTPVPQTEIKDDWSEMVEALIRQHLGQPHLGQIVSVTGEYHNGDGTNVLRVRKPPIVSVQNVYISDISLVATDYVVFPGHVALKAQTFPSGVLNVSIDYTSGSVDVDPTVRLTAAAMVVAMLNYRRRYGADSSLKWGAAEQKLGEDTPNLNVGLTSHLSTIMKRMLRRGRVRAR